jgi:serine/threonine protein kinase
MANTGQRKTAETFLSNKSARETSLKVFGKYEVLEELDSRPYVGIFRGRDRIIQRDVLLKVFQLEPMSPPARQRFVREVRSTVTLTHPNIVASYDFEVQDGYAYLATEQLDGENLRDILNRKGHRTLESKLQLMIEVCEALEFAHAKEVVHRDIRPENIVVLKSGRPKIMDFAIADALKPMSNPDGFDRTTWEYLSPEQLRRQNADALSDVFSASVVFFELLTNSHPFPGMDVTGTIQMDSAPLITKSNPALPHQLAALIARGLSLDPADRIRSAAGFVKELRVIAADQGLLSAELAKEVITFRAKIIEVLQQLALNSPEIQTRLSEIDFSILERLTPALIASITSEMDYFSIVDLRKECFQTLDSIERIVAEDAASQEVPLSEMNFSFRAASENVNAPGKISQFAEEKLSLVEGAIKTGNVGEILAIVNEVSRRKQKWYDEYSLSEGELENLGTACNKALDAVVEIARVQIQSDISRGDVAAAEEHFQTIEQLCSREARYSELAALIREQLQDTVNRSEREEPSGRRSTAELISDSGRICTGCRQSNPMEAVVCESCGLRLPGTRHLTPVLEGHGTRPQRKSRVVSQPHVVVEGRLSRGRLFAAAGATVLVVLILAIAAFLLVPKSPRVVSDAPVIGTAVVAKDAFLRAGPGSGNKATPVSKGESVEMLGKIPDMKMDGWVEVRLKANESRGFVGMTDIDSIHTNSCSFDLWHVALFIPGMDALERTQKSGRLRQVEAEMGRCPASVTDDLRMTMAETYAQEAAAIPWKSAQNDIREASVHLGNIQNPDNYSRRIETVNHTLDGLAPATKAAPTTPAQTAAVSAPTPAKSANVDVADKLLQQGKIDLENAETRIQLNSVIANMNAISNMSFTDRGGLAIQVEAGKVRDKAANSLGLVK